MTNSTTEPTHSVRERLALALHRKIDPANDFYARYKSGCPNCLGYVDIFLSEIQEPSEGTQKAAIAASTCPQDNMVPALVWQAMIQHIRDGGQ